MTHVKCKTVKMRNPQYALLRSTILFSRAWEGIHSYTGPTPASWFIIESMMHDERWPSTDTKHHCSLASTKLYCVMTVAHVDNLPTVIMIEWNSQMSNLFDHKEICHAANYINTSTKLISSVSKNQQFMEMKQPKNCWATAWAKRWRVNIVWSMIFLPCSKFVLFITHKNKNVTTNLAIKLLWTLRQQLFLPQQWTVAYNTDLQVNLDSVKLVCQYHVSKFTAMAGKMLPKWSPQLNGWWRGVVASIVRRMNEVTYGRPG